MGGEMGGLSLREGDAETWDNLLCADSGKFATVKAAEDAFKADCKAKYAESLCAAVMDSAFKSLKDTPDAPWSPSDKLCQEIDELITASDDNKAALLLDRSAIQQAKDADSQLDAVLLGKGVPPQHLHQHPRQHPLQHPLQHQLQHQQK